MLLAFQIDDPDSQHYLEVEYYSLEAEHWSLEAICVSQDFKSEDFFFMSEKVFEIISSIERYVIGWRDFDNASVTLSLVNAAIKSSTIPDFEGIVATYN